MDKYSQNRDINRIVKDLIDDGWTAQRRKSHWQVVPPSGGKPLTVPNTPSDGRAILNFKADIKRSNHVT